jgi:hypothetical protein
LLTLCGTPYYSIYSPAYYVLINYILFSWFEPIQQCSFGGWTAQVLVAAAQVFVLAGSFLDNLVPFKVNASRWLVGNLRHLACLAMS